MTVDVSCLSTYVRLAVDKWCHSNLPTNIEFWKIRKATVLPEFLGENVHCMREPVHAARKSAQMTVDKQRASDVLLAQVATKIYALEGTVMLSWSPSIL